MFLLILFVFLALIISFLCSILEATLLSVHYPFAKVLMDKGKRSGRILFDLKKNIDRPLAAILTMNTIAHTIGATGAGAQAYIVFGNEWIALFTTIFTLAILIFTEIIPKTLGSVYWRQIAPSAAYIIKVMIIIVYPLVIVSQFIARFMTPSRKIPRVTREEMIAMVQIGEDDGAIFTKEEKCIINLLRLSKIPVENIMTPLSVVECYPEDYEIHQVMEETRYPSFSRLPIYKDYIQNFTGFVLRSEILLSAAKDEDYKKLKELSRPLHFVLETDSVRKILDEFIERKEHLFAVVNLKGKVTGIVTLEDAMETLLGMEIMDESDKIEDLREYAKRRFKSFYKLPVLRRKQAGKFK